MDLDEEDEVTDIREQMFHNTVREHIVSSWNLHWLLIYDYLWWKFPISNYQKPRPRQLLIINVIKSYWTDKRSGTFS
jgi:hypothetical protein